MADHLAPSLADELHIKSGVGPLPGQRRFFVLMPRYCKTRARLRRLGATAGKRAA